MVAGGQRVEEGGKVSAVDLTEGTRRIREADNVCAGSLSPSHVPSRQADLANSVHVNKATKLPLT